MNSPSIKHCLKVFPFILGIFLIVIILNYTGITLKTGSDIAAKIPFYYIMAIVASNYAIIALLGEKWRAIMASLKPMMAAKRGYFTYYTALGMMANICLPHIGTGLKIGSLKTLYGVPLSIGAVSMIIHQVFEFLVMMIFVVPSLLFVFGIVTIDTALRILIPVLLFLGGISFLKPVVVFDAVLGMFKKLRRIMSLLPLARRYTGNAGDLDQIGSVRKMAGMVLVLSYLKFAATILNTYLIMMAVGMNISIMKVFLVAPLVYLVGLVGITPSGLGIVDAGWLGILLYLGIDRPMIGHFLLAERVLGTAASAMVVLITYSYYAGSSLLPKLWFKQESIDLSVDK